jgi:hypothetical protein
VGATPSAAPSSIDEHVMALMANCQDEERSRRLAPLSASSSKSRAVVSSLSYHLPALDEEFWEADIPLNIALRRCHRRARSRRLTPPRSTSPRRR